MTPILMMILEDCPYCQRALGYMEELKAECPEYRDIPVQIADENKEKKLADSLDYYYVPTYYVGGIKVHEGAADKQQVKAVLDKALMGRG